MSMTQREIELARELVGYMDHGSIERAIYLDNAGKEVESRSVGSERGIKTQIQRDVVKVVLHSHTLPDGSLSTEDITTAIVHHLEKIIAVFKNHAFVASEFISEDPADWEEADRIIEKTKVEIAEDNGILSSCVPQTERESIGIAWFDNLPDTDKILYNHRFNQRIAAAGFFKYEVVTLFPSCYS